MVKTQMKPEVMCRPLPLRVNSDAFVTFIELKYSTPGYPLVSVLFEYSKVGDMKCFTLQKAALCTSRCCSRPPPVWLFYELIVQHKCGHHPHQHNLSIILGVLHNNYGIRPSCSKNFGKYVLLTFFFSLIKNLNKSLGGCSWKYRL